MSDEEISGLGKVDLGDTDELHRLSRITRLLRAKGALHHCPMCRKDKGWILLPKTITARPERPTSQETFSCGNCGFMATFFVEQVWTEDMVSGFRPIKGPKDG